MSIVSPDTYAELAPMRRDEPLARWTTLRLGGPAEFFFEPRTPDDLWKLLTRLDEDGVPYRMLGGGANVLAPDSGVPGAVIHTGGMRRVFRDGELGLRAWAGATNQQLVRSAAEHGMAGVEELIGVPGHVGGSLAMNAGSPTWGLWDQVEEVTLWLPGGEVVARTPDDVQPSYRNGNLRGAIALEVLLKFSADRPQAVKERQEAYLRRKNETQPVTLASAGCAFRNPEGDSAGRLIDAAGLKGVREGSVVVSEKHANFLVHEGGGTAAQARTLLAHIAATVQEKFGVALHQELVIWPELV
ncbi:MAG: UDP-N-acetylmuramate dehydrogenase [Planctomycetes bacterium]|nr:UDP-N-acetylmuramate dehydrogenase [Planctomycetota bacterium]